MKKLIALILVVIICSLSMVSCQSIVVSLIHRITDETPGYYTFTEFTDNEKELFETYVDYVPPFIPTDEYNIVAMNGDGDYSEGIRYYTLYNTREDFNAFIPALSSGVRKGYEGTGPAGMPLLKRKEEYAYENGNYRLVSSLDCVYDAIPRGVVIVDYYATQVYHGYVTTVPDFDEIYHFPIYAGCKYERRPIKEIYVGYHPSGNDTTVVNTSYVSRPSLETPLRDSTVSRTEGGAYRRMEYRYADNWSNGRYATMKLKEQHCLSTPIWRGMVYENRDVIALPDTLFPVSPLNLDKDPVPSPIKPSLPSVKADMEELVNYGWFSIKGENYLLPSSHVEYHLGNESWREDVLSRDTNGNITSVKEKGQPETVILWGYSGRLPVAVIRNATLEQVQTAYGDRPSAMEGAALSPVPPQVYLDKVAGLRAALPQAHITTYTHIPGITG